MKQRTTSVLAMLAVLLLVVGASQIKAVAAEPDQPEKFQKTFPLSNGGTVAIDNYKGTIHVTAAAGNQVTVDVLKKFDGGDSDRKWWMENTKVDFSNTSNRVTVHVTYPDFTCVFCWSTHDFTASVELEIHVPRQVNVEIESYKPDIRVSGVEGDIRVNSYKSSMIIEETNGGLRIDTYKDDIRLRNVRVKGPLEVKSYKADLDISAVNLSGGADLSTDKGSIVLRVPTSAGFEVDYEGGRRASFRSDFPMNTRASGESSEVRGTINQGGPRLRLRTTKGSIALEKLADTQ